MNFLFFSDLIYSATGPGLIDSHLQDRARGSFLGLAYGDALGLLTEGLRQKEIHQIYGRMDFLSLHLPLDAIKTNLGDRRFYRTRIPGFTSDDTQQAMALLLVVLQQKNIRWGDDGMQEFSHLLVSGFKVGAWRGYGKMFSSAAQKLQEGVDYRHSGSASSGIGAAMRVPSLAGLLHWPDDELGMVAITTSLTTHADLRAAAMSFAVFKAARMLVNGVSLQQVRATLPSIVMSMEDLIIDLAANKTWLIDITDPHAVSSVLQTVLTEENSRLSLTRISDLVVQVGNPYVEARYKNSIHPNNPFSLLGGVHALAQALQDEADPLAILRYLVNLGDDTDTVAAIAGGILGARLGTGWIPTAELIDEKRFLQYADGLITGVLTEDADQFLNYEAQMTNAEKYFQSVQLPQWQGTCTELATGMAGVILKVAK